MGSRSCSVRCPRVVWRFNQVRRSAQPILRVMKNPSRGIWLGTALTALSFLSACGGGFSASTFGFDVALDPNPLGYEITDDGVIVPSHIMTFNSTAGSVGATIEGYTVEYRDSSGNNIFPGDSVQNSRGSLNVRVPAGIQCPPFNDAPVLENCTVNTPGSIYARGEPAFSAPTFLLPIDIINQYSGLVGVGGAVGATANVTFYGTDDLQRRFESAPFQFAISRPVGN